MPDPTAPLSTGSEVLLPLWLRDWRILMILLVLAVLGGGEGGRALVGLLTGTPVPAATSCQAIEPRIAALEEAAKRNDLAHERMLLMLARRGHASPSPARDASPTSALPPGPQESTP